MDSNPQESSHDQLNLWQWFISSPTRMAGLTFLAIAFVLVLALMLIISPKFSKKTEVIPQADPTTKSSQNEYFIPLSSFTDTTKDWDMISKKDFSLKIPPKAKTFYKENIDGASGSAFLRVDLNSQKETTEQAGLIIEVRDKNRPLQYIIGAGAESGEKIDLSQQEYLRALNDPKKKIITKSIDILIGGNKGYEFYFEDSYYNTPVKIRLIEFSTKDKHYVLSGPLEPQIETILSTIIIK